MDFGKFSFGSIEIDGEAYEHDVVIDRGRIRKRKKKVSRKFREQFGHTPLSLEGDTLEMSAADSRLGKIRRAPGDGRSETRGTPARRGYYDSADGRGD